MDSAPTPPAAIYCRISKDAEASGLGVKRQERECRELARRRGWTSVELYSDNDISAYSGKPRPEYLRMLDDLRNGDLSAVVAWDPDRLHRSPRELEDFIDIIEASGAPVVMVTSGDVDFSTANGRMQARVKGSVARYESEHRSERTVGKHAQLAEQGRWKGGPRPYGYDVTRDVLGRPLKDGRLVVIDEEAAIIREAGERVLAGESVYSVCADLNARGVSTAQDKLWRTPTLRRILTNPTTAGKREYRGEIVGPGLWESILDEVTWQRLRSVVNNKQTSGRGRTSAGRPGRRTYLLTGGLAVCGLCESNLHAQRRQSGARTYACISGPDKEGCGRLTCTASALDELVSEAVIFAVDGPELANTLRGSDSEEDVGSQEIAELERDLADLASMFGTGQIGRAEWVAARKGVELRLAAARRAQTREARSLALASYIGQPGALNEAWPSLTLDHRRAILSAVLDRVIVKPATRRGPIFDPKRVDLRWKV